jgi:hypothetical protein
MGAFRIHRLFTNQAITSTANALAGHCVRSRLEHVARATRDQRPPLVASHRGCVQARRASGAAARTRR